MTRTADLRPTFLMASAHDLRTGIAGRCRTLAAAIRQGRYAVGEMTIPADPHPSPWLVPLGRDRGVLPEIRLVDDPVPVAHLPDDLIVSLAAEALEGAFCTPDQGEAMVGALHATAVAASLVERCRPDARRRLRVSLPTVWGPAHMRDLSATPDLAGLRDPVPVGPDADPLPRCSLVERRSGGSAGSHVRLGCVSVIRTQDDLGDPLETLRALAGLEGIMDGGCVGTGTRKNT